MVDVLHGLPVVVEDAHRLFSLRTVIPPLSDEQVRLPYGVVVVLHELQGLHLRGGIAHSEGHLYLKALVELGLGEHGDVLEVHLQVIDVEPVENVAHTRSALLEVGAPG